MKKVIIVFLLAMTSLSAFPNDKIVFSSKESIKKLFNAQYLGNAKTCVNLLLDNNNFKVNQALGMKLKSVIIEKDEKENRYLFSTVQLEPSTGKTDETFSCLWDLNFSDVQALRDLSQL